MSIGTPNDTRPTPDRDPHPHATGRHRVTSETRDWHRASNLLDSDSAEKAEAQR